MGLNAEADVVACTLTASGLNTTQAGIPITGIESIELTRRDNAGLSVSRLSDELQSRWPDTYGGFWLDHKAGGVLRVATTRDSADLTARIRSAVPAETVVSMEHATYSLAALADISKSLWGDVDSYRDQGLELTSSHISAQRNGVIVSVSPDSPRDGTDLVDKFGSAVRLSVANAAIVQTNPRDYGTGYVYGGKFLFRYDGAKCTASTPSVRNYLTEYFAVTAGHCGSVGWGFREGNISGSGIGTVQYSGFHGHGQNYHSLCDCDIIGNFYAPYHTNRYLDTDNAAQALTTGSRSSDFYQGRLACISRAGPPTGLLCAEA